MYFIGRIENVLFLICIFFFFPFYSETTFVTLAIRRTIADGSHQKKKMLNAFQF